ncbi:cytidylyltransferase family protein [Pseudohyphozyma bogoriensis]|nr:cytidylyltransferase family protein [Pseudohyphozyma bogoriensis]
MMVELAKDLSEEGREVAVAKCSVPMFVEKSRIVREELDGRVEGTEVRLEFPLGWDTVIRFFNPKYYTSPSTSFTSFFHTDHSTLLCARRGDISSAEETSFLNSSEVKPWADGGGVVMVDLEEEVRGISSTAIREAVKEGRGLEGLVGKGVERVIERDGLYKE